MPEYTDKNMDKRPAPKILSLDDAKKLAEYDGLVNKVVGLNLDVEKLRDCLIFVKPHLGLSMMVDECTNVLESTKPNN